MDKEFQMLIHQIQINKTIKTHKFYTIETDYIIYFIKISNSKKNSLLHMKCFPTVVTLTCGRRFWDKQKQN